MTVRRKHGGAATDAQGHDLTGMPLEAQLLDGPAQFQTLRLGGLGVAVAENKDEFVTRIPRARVRTTR